jgi:hypothetical protein
MKENFLDVLQKNSFWSIWKWLNHFEKKNEILCLKKDQTIVLNRFKRSYIHLVCKFWFGPYVVFE